MEATDKGILISQAELAALLDFAGDDDKYGVVHFRINGSAKLLAGSSDGKRAVECTANGLGKAGEWHVDRQLVEGARRLLDPTETKALLKCTDKGLKEVHVVGIEDGTIRGRYSFANELTSTQISMQNIPDEIEAGSEVAANMKGTWFAADMRSLKPVIKVQRAANEAPVTFYPPKKPTGRVLFETRSGDGHWKGVICPVAVIGPGDESRERRSRAAAAWLAASRTEATPARRAVEDREGQKEGSR